MRPILLCSSCEYAKEPDLRGARMPDTGGTLTCPTCGEQLLLCAYGVMDREPAPSALNRDSLERVRGTWWR